jgi:hypothetical protein
MSGGPSLVSAVPDRQQIRGRCYRCEAHPSGGRAPLRIVSMGRGIDVAHAVHVSSSFCTSRAPQHHRTGSSAGASGDAIRASNPTVIERRADTGRITQIR